MATSRPWKRLLLASAAVIDESQRVLLVRRREPSLPQLDGNLELPGGKVEPCERVAQAAMREAFEETGVRVRARAILGEPYEATRHYATVDVDVFIVCYLCTPEAAGVEWPPLMSGKVAEVAWIPLREVDALALQPATLQFLGGLVRTGGVDEALHSRSKLVMRDLKRGHDYTLTVEGCLSDEEPLMLRRTWQHGSHVERFRRRDDLLAKIDRLVRQRPGQDVVLRRDPQFPLTPAVARLPEAAPAPHDPVLF